MPDLRPCVKCGQHIVVGDPFCPRCGAEQPVRATDGISGSQESRWEDIERRLQKATEGRYQIRGLIGRGGMAAVYLADWPHMDLRIAIKVMDPYLLDQEHAVHRFLQEARTIAKLKHRNIIRVYDSGRHGDLYFFCMDYYPGRSLEQVLQAEGQIPVPVARAWLWQAADALGYAHRQAKPVVHRDVKPSNMLLDAEGDLVLTDFGIAKVRDVESTSPSASITMPGAVLGTPAYLSPEQAAAILNPGEVGKAVPVTSASDQYSLGVVAYEMLAGELPFRGELGPLLTAHTCQTAIHLLERRPDCPPDFADAVMRMLAKRPEDRWQDMQELGAVLATSSPPGGSPLRVQMSALAKGERSVGTIFLSPVPGSLFEGQDFKIDATPLDLVGRPLQGRRLSWVSSDPDIALVTQDGIVSALRAGAVSITATAEGVSEEIRLAIAPIPIDAVVVLPTQVTLAVGDTATLRTLLLSQEGKELEGRAVAWSSSDSAVAAVDGEGKVVGHQVGSVRVTASSENRSGSASVNVVPRAVSQVEVSPAALTLEVGVKGELRALPRDSTGEPLKDRSVTWESDDTAVVKVLGDGKVVGVAPGRVGVRAVCDGVTGSGSVVVLPPRVASLRLEPAAPSVLEGDALRLEATAQSNRGIALPDRPIWWESENPRIVAVEEGGRVKGVRPGSVQVHAYCEGVTASVVVQVNPAPVASVAILPSTLSLVVGEPRALAAVARGPSGDTLPGRTVTWSSSDPEIATVSPRGVVQPLSVGRVRVTAACEGQLAEAEVTVTPVPVAAIEVEEALALEVGETRTLSPVLRGKGGGVLEGRALAWSSPRPEVASVDADGRILGVQEGSAEIRVECEGVSRTVEVQVVAAQVVSLHLAPPALQLVAEESARMEATPVGKSGRPLHGRSVRWSTEDPEVASVAEDGTVEGVGPGDTTIWALCDQITSSAPVVVAPAVLASLEARPPDLSLAVGETSRLEAVPRSGKGARLEGRTVIWSSSDPLVAEVSQEGVVTACGEGAATIEVKAEGQTAQVLLTVGPERVASLVVQSPVSSLPEGESVRLQSRVLGSSGRELAGRKVSWTSGSPERASVDPDGTLQGLAPGRVTVTAQCEGKEASLDLRVDPAPVASLDITPSAPSLLEGEEVHLHCALQDRRGRELGGRRVSWSSSDPAVARVDQRGLVTGVSPGSVAVEATCQEQSQRVQVVVRALPVVLLELKAPKPEVRVGQTQRLHAVTRAEGGRPLEGRKLEWESGDPTVATVDAAGQVTGVAPGVVRIGASCQGVRASATFTVKEARGPIRPWMAGVGGVALVAAVLAVWQPWARRGEEITVPETPPGPVVTALAILPGDSLTLVQGDLLELSLDGRDEAGVRIPTAALPHPLWETSDSGVATVSQEGILTSSAPGLARVVASVPAPAGGTVRISASAVVVVTPPPGEGVAAGQETAPPAEERPAPIRPTPTPETERPAQRPTTPPTQAPVVTELRLTPPQGELTQGEALQLRLTDQNGRPVSGEFATSDLAVATVSSAGLLSAAGAGQVTVTATFENLSTTGTFRVRPLVVDPPSSALDSLRQGLAQAQERASLAEYDAAYGFLDAVGGRLRELEGRYEGSSLLPPARAEYLEAFSTVYEGCRRFRQVQEQRGVTALPTCRPPPTGGGNDAHASPSQGGIASLSGIPGNPSLPARPGASALHP